MTTEKERIETINKFCIEQMQESDLHIDSSAFQEGIWLACSKIHNYITKEQKLQIVTEE